MAQDFESNGAQITNSATTIYTSNSDDAVVGLSTQGQKPQSEFLHKDFPRC